MTDDEFDTSDRITAALADAIKAGELGDTTVGMPGAWVLVGCYHDGDGDERAVSLPFSHAHLLTDQPLPVRTGSTRLVFTQPTPRTKE